MTDYYSKLEKALRARAGLTREGREAVYEVARRALTDALRKVTPTPFPSALRAERAEFERAVARIEAEFLQSALLAAEPAAPSAPVASRNSAPPAPAALQEPNRSALAPPEESDPPAPMAPKELDALAPMAPQESHEEERPMSRLDEMNKILRKLQNESPGVEASALISEDGLVMASALAASLDESRIGGMTATLLNLGARAAAELGRGGVKEIIIRGDNGYAVVLDAGRGALLLALANETAKLGMIFFDMNEAIRALRKVL